MRAQARAEWHDENPELPLDALMVAIYLRVLFKRAVGPQDVNAILSLVLDAVGR